MVYVIEGEKKMAAFPVKKNPQVKKSKEKMVSLKLFTSCV